MNESIGLHVRVKAISTSLEPDDEGIAGTYLVEVGADLPPGQQASLALDAFHEKIGIACLDDFDIQVMNPRTYEILIERDDEGDETKPAPGNSARFIEKIMSGLEGTEFTVNLAAVNIDNPRDRVEMGWGILVAENIEDLKQRALDLMWDSRLDSASCRPDYTITHETEIIPPPGALFWWSDVHGNHRAKTIEHEFLVAASESDAGVFKACVDDRHEHSAPSILTAKLFCQQVQSRQIAKRSVTRP